MQNKPPTQPDASHLSKGPALTKTDQGVHIIFVPVEAVAREMNMASLGHGPVGTATLKHVAKHIGKPAPTDVTVFAGQPWHFAGGELRSHPKVHDDFPETILVLSIAKKQTAVWWSETPFNITDIKPSANPADPHPGFPEALSAAPHYPFAIPCVTRVEQDAHGRDIFVARSTVPVDAAKKHMYKISFTMGGNAIDPDTYCSP